MGILRGKFWRTSALMAESTYTHTHARAKHGARKVNVEPLDLRGV